MKRLYRPRRDRMIAGVCAGLAEYFEIDPSIVRLLFVGGLFVGAPGVLPAYIVMALIVPEAPVDEPASIAD
ncbi:MAG: PspC domain-containing protein [Anaerolineales bacterium]|nr:PspC domain-containing protein [Anaerolineales bacterium]